MMIASHGRKTGGEAEVDKLQATMSLLTASASRCHPLIQRLAACPLPLTMPVAELGTFQGAGPRRPHAAFYRLSLTPVHIGLSHPAGEYVGGGGFSHTVDMHGADVVAGLAGPDPPRPPARGWSSSSTVPRCLPNRGMPRTATSPQCAFASAPFLAHPQAHNSIPHTHTLSAATSTSHATTHGVHNPPSPTPSPGGCGTYMVHATAAPFVVVVQAWTGALPAPAC